MNVKKNRSRKIGWMIAIIVLIGAAAFVYGRYYFVFGQGVKAGELNYVVYKGVVFKTYEGKLIQSGLRSGKPGAVQSYEFRFSVVDKDIAEQLMKASGKNVELHYKEYFGALPWRGYSNFIVDSIVAIQETSKAMPQEGSGF